MARCIRRATVDAFWSRETAAVNGLRSVMKAAFKKAALVEGAGSFPSLDPFPVHDGDGMGSAVLQLLKTLDPGKHEKCVQCEMAEKCEDRARSCVGGLSGKQRPDGDSS
jgi:hypothetical protein